MSDPAAPLPGDREVRPFGRGDNPEGYEVCEWYAAVEAVPAQWVPIAHCYREADAAFLARGRDRLARLERALADVKRVLTVPAAEYVPAIPDAWGIIDAALADTGGPT